jgi:hypothetical protein
LQFEEAKDGGVPSASLKPAAENMLQIWPVSKRLSSSRAPNHDPAFIDKIAICWRQVTRLIRGRSTIIYNRRL